MSGGITSNDTPISLERGEGRWEVSEDAIARLEEQIKTLFNDGQRRESTIKDLACDIKEIKEELANRLPIWATLAISALMGLCGFLGAKAF